LVSFDLGGEKLNTARIVFTAFFATFILIPFLVHAQEEDSSLPDVPAETQQERIVTSEDSIILGESLPQSNEMGGTSVWIVLRMVIVLVLAALAIYGVVFFIKRLSRPSQARDPNLKVLATLPLGTDCFAAVISVGKKAWLVGGGSGAGVRYIAEIDEQEALETMLLDEAEKNAETGNGRILDFRAMLNRLGNSGRNALGSHAESLRKQRERLKGL
jgi:flagellar protein FliO/FliZ